MGQAGKRMGGGVLNVFFYLGGGEVAELRTRPKNCSQSAKIMFAHKIVFLPQSPSSQAFFLPCP